MLAGEIRICDLHTHTTFSDGRLVPAEVVEIAKARGYGVGIADHCGRGSFQLQSDEQLQRYLQALEPLPVLRSAELDLGNDGQVSPNLLGRCDYLIGGIHSLNLNGRRLDFFDPEAGLPSPELILEGILAAIEEGCRRYGFHILAHPGLLPLALRPEQEGILDDEWDEELIALAVRYGFALELSSRWLLPGPGTIEKARSRGVKFSLGSDGHERTRVCDLAYSLEMMNKCRLGQEDVFRPPNLARIEVLLSSPTAPTGSSRSTP